MDGKGIIKFKNIKPTIRKFLPNVEKFQPLLTEEKEWGVNWRR